MIKEEWKAMKKNKFLIVVLAAVALIPALYNIIFLSSMWDPYGNVDHLPVAVVNKDKAVTYQGSQLQVGSNLVENLKESKSLDYSFVSSEEAETGINDGTYYMVITIPENFSENATSLVTQTPKEMQITYQTTQGKSFIASKMSDSAIVALKSKVSQQVTEMYTKAILANLNKVGVGMSEAANGSDELETGTNQLQTASATIQDNLAKLSSSSLEFSQGSEKLSIGLSQYVSGVEQVDQGAVKLTTGLTTLAGNVPALSDGLNQLSTGAGTLTTGVEQYTSGVGSLSEGTNQLSRGLNSLNSQLPLFSTGLTALSQGAQKLDTGIQQYTAGVDSVTSGSVQLNNGLAQLNEQTKNLPEKINQLNSGAQTLADSLQAASLSDDEKNQLLAYVDGVNEYLTQVSSAFSTIDLTSLENIDQLAAVIQSATSELAAAKENTAAINEQINEEKATLNAAYQGDLATQKNAVATALATTGDALTEEQKTAVLAALDNQNSQTLAAIDEMTIDTSELTSSLAQTQAQLEQIAAGIATLQNIPTTQIAAIKTSADQLNLASETAVPGLKQVINGLSAIATEAVPGAQTLAQGTQVLAQTVPQLTAAIQTLNQGSNQLVTGTTTLSQNSTTLNDGANQVNEGLETAKDKTTQLASGTNQLDQGAKQVSSGAEQLNNKSEELVGGTSALAVGLTTVVEKIPTFSSGIDALLTGAQTLSDGTNQLAENGGTLLSGGSQLTTGAAQIAEGSQQLSSGEQQVTTALGKVDDGLLTLTDKLSSGAAQLAEVNTGTSAADAIASPVTTEHIDKDKVANNGTAMAPYMMSVALFVGTITVNMMFDAFKPKKKPNSATAWWASKMSVLGVVAIVQAILVYFVLTVFLGLDPVSPGKTFAFLLLESLTFMSFVTMFNVILGKIGAFLMLIFLLLQLAGSGGTYPIVLSNGFFQSISPFLPMTYSVEALRQGISVGHSMLVPVVVFVALFIVCNLILIFYYNHKIKKNSFTDLLHDQLS